MAGYRVLLYLVLSPYLSKLKLKNPKSWVTKHAITKTCLVTGFTLFRFSVNYSEQRMWFLEQTNIQIDCDIC